MDIETHSPHEESENSILAPAPTSWPIILAFGITLVFAGLVTSHVLSVLGGVLSLFGIVGWFRDVLPHEAHEAVPLERVYVEAARPHREVAHVELSQELKRAWLPVEIHPVSAGVKGGLAGSVVMAALAMMYGIVSQNGIWYPINLLAAGFLPANMTSTTEQLSQFNLGVFAIAAVIHLVTSLLVGLLYGAMLPMLPQKPILLGGFIAPIVWSGLIYGVLDIVNPVLNQRIHWVWFIISQMGFGIVAGIVVSRTEKIRTGQRMPLALAAGMEASGLAADEEDPTR
jgi:hypothetical protein